MRDQGSSDNDLLARLAADPRIPLDRNELAGLLSRPLDFVGTAPTQVQRFASRVELLTQRYPDALAYEPAPIL